MEPRNPYLWELESQLYFYMDKYEDVIICCDKALRLDSENVFSLSCKGKAYIIWKGLKKLWSVSMNILNWCREIMMRLLLSEMSV